MTTALLSDKFRTLISKDFKRANRIDQSVFGQKVGLAAKLFGCWHNDLSRPFVQDKIAYRSCLHCGARKQFNSETLETHGTFYFPPPVNGERA